MFTNSTEKVSLKSRLTKPRSFLAKGLSSLFSSSNLDENQLDDIEDHLLLADVGVPSTQKIMDVLRETIGQANPEPRKLVKEQMTSILRPCMSPRDVSDKPYVIVMVGVNGVGKTTTTAKLAHQFIQEGKQVMLAAADTFRAAAIDQLKEWGQRLSVPVISHEFGGDSAAVAHDAYQSALAKNVEILIIDTAGRQHTQSDLMVQLEKVVRVLKKLNPNSPHEIIQVLDAGNGQNALMQLRAFRDAVDVNSICLTKLDGSAKGGILLALAEEFALPVRSIGVGEGLEDLRVFDAAEFVEALLPAPTN